MKSLIQTSKILILSIAVLTIASFAQAEWNNPSTSATGGNTATPINVSTSQQDKAGKFTASVVGADSLCLTGAGCIESWPTGESGGSSVTILDNPALVASVNNSYVNTTKDLNTVSGVTVPDGATVVELKGTASAGADNWVYIDVNGNSLVGASGTADGGGANSATQRFNLNGTSISYEMGGEGYYGDSFGASLYIIGFE